jgi:xylulose-5-phosphate/fructose-6-phosphate phosphoketolase
MPEFNATTEPKPSSLPEDLFGLLAKYDPKKDGPSEEELKDLETFQRACNYLSVAQIFLVKAPISPEKEMTKDWVKKRLLGHFGTCPGLALVFAHVNLMIQKIPEAKFMVVTGPGHGAPAVLSALYLEGSITCVEPPVSLTSVSARRADR